MIKQRKSRHRVVTSQPLSIEKIDLFGKLQLPDPRPRTRMGQFVIDDIVELF
jgi:hypothetical protein